MNDAQLQKYDQQFQKERARCERAGWTSLARADFNGLAQCVAAWKTANALCEEQIHNPFLELVSFAIVHGVRPPETEPTEIIQLPPS